MPIATRNCTSQEAAKTAATGSQPNSSNPAWGDLDANGNWYDVPGQGYVWSPYEAADSNWDPYGSGNWVYTPQFGYVWVSCESWGYMPYIGRLLELLRQLRLGLDAGLRISLVVHRRMGFEHRHPSGSLRPTASPPAWTCASCRADPAWWLLSAQPGNRGQSHSECACGRSSTRGGQGRYHCRIPRGTDQAAYAAPRLQPCGSNGFGAVDPGHRRFGCRGEERLQSVG